MEKPDPNPSQTSWQLEATSVQYNVRAISGWFLFAVGILAAMLFLFAEHPFRSAWSAFVALIGAKLITRSRGPLRRVRLIQFELVQPPQESGTTTQEQ
ncbi:hypothetical protein [Burkholderia vietnamiensis]|uniref:hypothetical protein n=1 Tax=Burkholderia vietnamiensis TaxID=60552 RepID=UPI000B1510FB|nr:hypothetical protein [Burkholderia vietnamiensis]